MQFRAASAVLDSGMNSKEEPFLLENRRKKQRKQTMKRGLASPSKAKIKGGELSGELSNDVYDQPGHLIRRAQQIAVSMFYSTVGYEVTPVQYGVLRILQDYPGIDQVTLARLCALDTSTAANLAVRLEQSGLVKRMVPANSKRFRVLRITPQGAALLRKLLPSGRLLSRRLLQALDKKEQKIFLRLLKKFVHLNNDESRAPLDRAFTGTRNGNGNSSGSRLNHSAG
jgi:MarR family transcriptional regulator, temperature-dependent positive regulator of motility